MNDIIKTDNRHEIDVYDRMNDPIAAIEAMGNWFFKSGLFGITTPAAGAVAAIACMTERTNPLELARRYYFIDGQLSMKSEAMLAIFRERGGTHRIVQRDEQAAEIELIPTNGDPVSFRFTWEEAKGESYAYQRDGHSLKTNWSTPRRRMQMMWARVVSDAVRAVDPGVVVGTYTPEEIQDFERPDSGRQPQSAVADRREELRRMDVTPEPEAVAEAEPLPAMPGDPDMSGEVDEPAPETCTTAQLQELLDLATECGIDKPTLRQKCCEYSGADEPQDMTWDQADELVKRLTDAIAKKQSTSK